ncbi:MAG: acetyl-CoA carboxylase biotin carboxylase subunit [Bdellovibrionaceae bacterium]|nr:acetyl-CoA carboxylase biotin carboxylase subunit [Pseudobdellovibrionaceae bacterium]
MFKKILIANRGEIAVRIIRTARTMGIESIAIFSEDDRQALHVLLADKAYSVGAASAKASYLNIKSIIAIAKKAKVDAIHPGYGFLSEDPKFAQAVVDAGIVFIGPSPEIIEKVGDKLSARAEMKKIKMPLLPGSSDQITSLEEAKKIADTIGYPIIIKATAGGGGKGIAKVFQKIELEKALIKCKKEGLLYFNDDRVFIEKLVLSPKHIEVQIFGDQKGNIVHLFERECSAQRRNQKVLEESPAHNLPPLVRKKICDLAAKAGKHLKYFSAGTIEFIYEPSSQQFYFMEINPRLQVEHPVTEMTVGVDLVKEQIQVAAGLALSWKQSDLKTQGHAIELRICAEDPKTFLPHPGKISLCQHPQGPFVRVDSCAYSGYFVPLNYDPLITKIIVWADSRETCIKRLTTAIKETRITGIKTNIILHKHILQHPLFIDATYHTGFIEKNIINKKHKEFFSFVNDHVFVITAALQKLQTKDEPTKNHSDWKDSSAEQSF